MIESTSQAPPEQLPRKIYKIAQVLGKNDFTGDFQSGWDYNHVFNRDDLHIQDFLGTDACIGGVGTTKVTYQGEIVFEKHYSMTPHIYKPGLWEKRVERLYKEALTKDKDK